jgi:hypothetical protein
MRPAKSQTVVRWHIGPIQRYLGFPALALVGGMTINLVSQVGTSGLLLMPGVVAIALFTVYAWRLEIAMTDDELWYRNIVGWRSIPLVDLVNVRVTRVGAFITTIDGATCHASALRSGMFATRDNDAFAIFRAAERARAAAGNALPLTKGAARD